MINVNKISFETSAGNLTQLPASVLPEIVFSGRSNVGKSSLINKLLNRKSLARTSSKPGKTVTLNFFKGENLRLVDMPGYGYAKVSFEEKKRWAKLIEGYFNSSRSIVLVIQIIDMRHPPSEKDMEMIDYLYKRQIPFIIVMTKSDKLNKGDRLKRETMIKDELKNYSDIQKIPFSAVKGEGVDEIMRIVSDSVNTFLDEGKNNA